MSQVYCSDLEQKMILVFKVFDFDSDGKISAEDVKLILSYIPNNVRPQQLS
jgi:Ca2+-binding EF-hand superfamily protein